MADGSAQRPVEPKPPVPPTEFGRLLDRRRLEAGEDELRHARPPRDRHRLRPGVPEQDAQLAAVVGVDGGRRVGEGEAVPQRQPRAGPHLTLHAGGQLHRQPRPHQPPLPRRQHQVGLGRGDVVARGAGRLPRREREVGVVREAEEADGHGGGADGTEDGAGARTEPRPRGSVAGRRAGRQAARTELTGVSGRSKASATPG